jgi:hypothetical protein
LSLHHSARKRSPDYFGKWAVVRGFCFGIRWLAFEYARGTARQAKRLFRWVIDPLFAPKPYD